MSILTGRAHTKSIYPVYLPTHLQLQKHLLPNHGQLGVCGGLTARWSVALTRVKFEPRRDGTCGDETFLFFFFKQKK